MILTSQYREPLVVDLSSHEVAIWRVLPRTARGWSRDRQRGGPKKNMKNTPAMEEKTGGREL